MTKFNGRDLGLFKKRSERKMNKEQIQRTIKLFRHRQEEAEREVEITKKSPACMFYSGKAKAYEFCADYLEANSQEKETEEVKKAEDLKIGDIIDNGSCGKNLGVVLIAKKRSTWMDDHHILLCSFPQKQEYVTWWADKQGETSQGHYFKSFVDAVKDYVCRGEKA